jgi:hypothetical protein
MTGWKKFWFVFWASLLGWSIGKALNVPVWRDWDIGNRVDITMMCAFLALGLAEALAERNEK